MGFVLIPECANLPHSICSCLEHSSTRYLPDFLTFLTSLLKYHLITKDYCLGLGFPKSRTWNKGLDAGSFGEHWSQGRESGRKERKLNQGYISELVDVVGSQSTVWLGPSVDHEECSPQLSAQTRKRQVGIYHTPFQLVKAYQRECYFPWPSEFMHFRVLKGNKFSRAAKPLKRE